MAHEITRRDNVVLHRTPAWHGLGIVVQDAPTPREALQLAGLDWEVQQWPLSATDGQRKIAIPDQVANVRDDTLEKLGVVSASWKPIQNRELAEFCECLAEQGDTVKIESAGSIRGGRKVWFLLKGESFSVRRRDEVAPYICASCGHDGWTALRLTATTVRVVCSNTLHMVIPDRDIADRPQMAARAKACYVVRHSGDIQRKVEEAKAALGLYDRSLAATRGMLETLAARDVKSAALGKFLTEMYCRACGDIPLNPATAAEERREREAQDAVAAMLARFERERELAGATAWNALNAFTNWFQHDRKTRGRDEDKIRDAKLSSQLFGRAGELGAEALAVALAL